MRLSWEILFLDVSLSLPPTDNDKKVQGRRARCLSCLCGCIAYIHACVHLLPATRWSYYKVHAKREPALGKQVADPYRRLRTGTAKANAEKRAYLYQLLLSLVACSGGYSESHVPQLHRGNRTSSITLKYNLYQKVVIKRNAGTRLALHAATAGIYEAAVVLCSCHRPN